MGKEFKFINLTSLIAYHRSGTYVKTKTFGTVQQSFLWLSGINTVLDLDPDNGCEAEELR